MLKIGAVVVPINPLLKENEIQHILSDSQSKYLIAHQTLLAQYNNDSVFEETRKNLNKVLCL